MVTSMKKEEVNKGRLTLASMLTGNPSNIGFSAAEPSVSLIENGSMTLKATMHPPKGKDAEALFIATDHPNFQTSATKSDHHRSFMEKNLDSLLIAWCDPVELSIPASYTQDVWIDVLLHEDFMSEASPDPTLRYDVNTRDVCIKVPSLDGSTFKMAHTGSLEFPFSILMIRETVMAYWQAFYEDSSQFYQHCGSCNNKVTDDMSFADRWSISFEGKCRFCEAVEIDMSAAIPKW